MLANPKITITLLHDCRYLARLIILQNSYVLPLQFWEGVTSVRNLDLGPTRSFMYELFCWTWPRTFILYLHHPSTLTLQDKTPKKSLIHSVFCLVWIKILTLTMWQLKLWALLCNCLFILFYYFYLYVCLHAFTYMYTRVKMLQKPKVSSSSCNSNDSEVLKMGAWN